MRNLWLALLPALAAFPAVAHDFWMQPRLFNPAAGSTVLLSMLVGHGTARERWGATNSNVVLFRTIGPDGMVDRKRNLSIGGPGFDALVPVERPGSYMFILQSIATRSQLPFLRFNDYAAAEGVTPIIAQRQRTGREKTDGREIYSRRAKAIVQVGPVDAASIARVVRPVNLQLEIVPGRHPGVIGPTGTMPVRVLWNGRPLAAALVKLTDLDADAEPVAVQRTDAAGAAVFRIPHTGKWQMNVVWAVPLRGDRRADFNTVFSSLTFAVP